MEESEREGFNERKSTVNRIRPMGEEERKERKESWGSEVRRTRDEENEAVVVHEANCRREKEAAS
jgi:hypothetical protein